MNTMTNKYYIFVHNTELIEHLEAQNKFTNLNRCYVLLSNKDFQHVTRSNVIVANRYKNNIEQYNNCIQFTGWHCMVNNNLIDTDYVTLLDYDVDVHAEFDKIVRTEIEKDHLPCYGYFDLPKPMLFLDHSVWSEGLVDYLCTKNISCPDILNDVSSPKWIVTTNITIKSSVLRDLVRSDLFNGLIDRFRNDKYTGHYLERFTNS